MSTFEQHKNTTWVMRSRRGRLSLLPNVYSMEAVTSLTKEILGISWKKILLTFENGNMSVSADKASDDAIKEVGIQPLLDNPTMFEQNLKEIREIAPTWITWLQGLQKKDLSMSSDQEIVDIHLQYREFYKEVYGRYFPIIILELNLAEHLQGLLEGRTKDVSDTFTKLTLEYNAMHTKHEMRDRLQRAIRVKQGEAIETVAAEHKEAYFWLTRDYEDTAMTTENAIARITEVLEKGNVEELAQKASDEERKMLATITALEQECQLTHGEKHLFASMRYGIHIKELRKKLVSQSLVYFDPVLFEICQRIGLELQQARALMPQDLVPALIERKPYKEILQKRVTKGVTIAEDGETHLYENEDAEALFSLVFTIDKNVREMKGLSGSAGLARGPACIVEHPSDFHKVKDGDVMITVQAVPSFIEPLRRCVGLVADGGTGITSHPATLARECGVPCVFQTKIATDIIKDGDIIEVDGNNGVVKIIDKKLEKKREEGIPIEREQQKESKESRWIYNFSIDNAGIQMLHPAIQGGFPAGLKTFFGEVKHIKSFLTVMEGVHLLGAYVKEDEITSLVDETITTIFENPEKIEKIHQEAYTHNEEYFAFAKKYIDADFSTLRDAELGKAYKKLLDIQIKAHGHALVTTWFVDSYDQKFSKLLMEKTKELLKNSQKEIGEVFTTLTTSSKNSLTLQEELESLGIVKEIQESPEKNKILAWNETAHMPTAAMEAHFQKWRWTPFAYLGPAYTRDYYLEVWKGLVKENIDVAKRIDELEQRSDVISKQKQLLAEELHIDKEMQQILDIAADIAFLKGYRKDVLYHGMFALSHILKEIARRLRLPINDMYQLTDNEVYGMLVHNDPIPVAALHERKKKHCFVYNYENDSVEEHREDGEEFLEAQTFVVEEVKEVDTLQGMVACSGYATGTVKIINLPADMTKMNQGDVLVSHTTMPSLLPAMNKAAAIITEDGGITCHAAIVSRELKIPCITGIKTATKVLKDGDIIEVDANNGVVTIIKKKED
jgi:phosphoenolpyruvate synthase/pyruvate phosphate dikinase